MTQQIRVGTSGWNYKHWKGVFYPDKLPSSKWFAHYCNVFTTVEINNSFYKLPTDHAVDQWREQAPDGFVYALKSSRFLTHNKKLKDAAEPLELVLSKARRLGEHLGPVLYQLPPNWKRNLDRLAEFLKLLPAEIVHVIEFRNRDWLANETYELLSEHQVCLCVHDILPRHPRRVTGPAIYVRLHGAAGARYAGKYPLGQLRSWAKWIVQSAQGRDVYVYFNNDAQGHAIQDAQAMASLLG